MSGILGGIVNALGAASQGGVIADQERVKSALQQAQIVRQQQQDQIAQAVRQRESNSSLLKDRLMQSQINDTDQQVQQRAYDVAHPKPVKPNYAPPITGPNGDVSLINLDDPTHPVKVPGIQGKVEHTPQGPVPHFAIQNVTGADGKIHLAKVNSLTGDVEELPNLGKQPVVPAATTKVDATHQMAGDHFGRAKKASDALDKFGGTWATSSQLGNWVAGHNPLDSSIQQANQAGEEFATMFAPILNKGRSTHIEIEQVKKSYVPKVGDSPATIQQKSEARADLLKQYAKYAQQADAATPSAEASPAVHPLKSKYGLE